MPTDAVLLHISADYPDVLAGNKTKAVANLLAATPGYRHIVYSLNRVDAFSGLESLPSGTDCTAVAYGALPKGLLWHGRLKAVAAWLLADLKAKNIRPQLVQAHKLTVEGVVAQIIARELNIPLAIEIWGDSDSKIYHNKRSLQGLYKQIAAESAVIFAPAPWTIDRFANLLGMDRAKCLPLPIIPGETPMNPGTPVTEDRLFSLFHLDSWQRKNLAGMTQAIARLAAARPTLRLDIYGTGSPKTLMAIRKALRDTPGSDRVQLMGPLQHSQLPALMKDYAAFLLPSKRESYGMVYAEALFNGLPVIYSDGWGIDGYFDPASIGAACDPNSVDSIAASIEQVLNRQTELKQSIAAMQRDGRLGVIQKDAILRTYRDGIERALASH